MKNAFTFILAGLTSLLLKGSIFAGPDDATRIYFDPNDQRIHAAVVSTVENGQLHLSVAALGALVEPMPGFRGRDGSNLQTAFEIDQLFAASRLEVITTDAFGMRMPDGYLTPGNRGRIPVRSIDSAGNIDFNAVSDGEYILDFSASGGALPAGEFRTELWARGEPRLRVDYQIEPSGNGRLLDFVEIGHGKTLPVGANMQFHYVDTDSGAVDEKLPAPVELAAWSQRDFEARWSLYRRSLDSGKTNSAWVSFLLEQKEYEFLEAIAMHELDTFGNEGIGRKLKDADSPNWLRLTFWMVETKRPRGHGGMVTDGLIYDKKQQDLITAWLKAHGLAEKHAAVLDFFIAEKPEPVDVDISTYPEPHDPAKFFHRLDAPLALEEFDPTAKKVEPGIVYTQQVKRAIDGLVTSGRYEQPWLGKLDQLRHHPAPAIRQSVYLALTHMGYNLIPADALAVANDEKEDLRVREAALLAHSYRLHFEAYPGLIEIASNPEHPAWRASLSRIIDLADPYAVEIVSALRVTGPEDTSFLKSSLTQLEARSAMMVTKQPAALAPTMLRRYAWMKANGNARAEAYLKSSDPIIQKSKAAIREKLVVLSQEKFAPEPGSSTERNNLIEAMNTTVQQLAKDYANSP